MSLNGSATAIQALKGKIVRLSPIPVIDSTLTKEGACAEAKATGEAIGKVQNNVEAVKQSCNGKLPKTGGSVTGNLVMNGNAVTGLAAPAEDTDAATKKFVEDFVSNEISSVGGVKDVTSHVRITSYGTDQTIHKATDNGSTIVIHAEGALAEGSLYITGLTGTPVAMLLFYNDTVGVMTFSGNKSLEDFSCSQDLMVQDPETGEWVESFWSGVSGRFVVTLYYV